MARAQITRYRSAHLAAAIHGPQALDPGGAIQRSVVGSVVTVIQLHQRRVMFCGVFADIHFGKMESKRRDPAHQTGQRTRRDQRPPMGLERAMHHRQVFEKILRELRMNYLDEAKKPEEKKQKK